MAASPSPTPGALAHGPSPHAVGPEGRRTFRAPAGTVVVVPPGVGHAFHNAEAPDAVFLNVHAPDAGFAAYMRDLRDGRPAAFDSYDLPQPGTRPGEEVHVAEGRHEGDDLVLAVRPDGIEITVPGAEGQALTFVPR